MVKNVANNVEIVDEIKKFMKLMNQSYEKLDQQFLSQLKARMN